MNISNDEITFNFCTLSCIIIANSSIVQHLPKHFVYVNLSNPHNDPLWRLYQYHSAYFTDKEPKTQGSVITYPKLHIK